MILTAFLSLAQLQMGSNDPAVDRLDRSAVQGLDRLTSDEGWFVPAGVDGMDYNNATADWHLQSAPSLDNGRVQAGLVSDGVLNIQKINAIQNLTEGDMIDGLGLDAGFSIHLTIEVVESTNASRIGTMLFDGGTERRTASASSTANRQFIQDGETWQVVLEVHKGGRLNNDLQITEVMTRPAEGGPAGNIGAAAPPLAAALPHLQIDGRSTRRSSAGRGQKLLSQRPSRLLPPPPVAVRFGAGRAPWRRS